MKDMTPEQLDAYAALVRRLDEYGRVSAGRDALIHEAHAGGISKAEIARRMDISRTTVVLVLGTDDNEGDSQ